LLYDDLSSVMVVRQGQPVPNSLAEIIENEAFQGDANPLVAILSPCASDIIDFIVLREPLWLSGKVV
jgi:hypothetical protein